MKSIWFLLFALSASVNAHEVRYFNEAHNPVRSILVHRTSENFERVERLEAEIRPDHVEHVVENGRVNFPTRLNQRFTQMKRQNDEKGHLVGAQFSGPAEWYNLSPQTSRVNRNVNGVWLHEDWFKTEGKAREFLNLGGERKVNWTVRMEYTDGNAIRPTGFHLDVKYLENGTQTRNLKYPDTIIYISNSSDGASLTVPPKVSRA